MAKRVRQPATTVLDFVVEDCGFDTPCHLYLGPLTDDGYGRVTIRNRRRPAHVAAYQAAIGPVPRGHQIHHKCEVRACINPSHLQAVTPAEHRHIHGPNYGNASLTQADADAMREACQRGVSVEVLVKQYDVSRNTIWATTRGLRWGLVEAPPRDLRTRPKHGLTDADIAEIMRLLSNGESQRSIAPLFGVSHTTIRKIYNRNKQ